MKFREKMKILYSLLGEEEESEEELQLDEILENRDILSDLMQELKEFSPGAGEVLIDERDSYLSQKILSIDKEKKTLAVIGAGHLSGVETAIRSRYDSDLPVSNNSIGLLEELPKRSLFSKVFPWLIPVLFFGMLYMRYLMVIMSMLSSCSQFGHLQMQSLRQLVVLLPVAIYSQ